MKKKSAVLQLLLLLFILLVACNNSSSQSVGTEAEVDVPSTPAAVQTRQYERDRTLRILFTQTPDILNPHLSTGSRNTEASRIAYEPLATFDKNGDLIPFLAAEIPTLANGGVDENGRYVIWQLKQDVQWADGEPFTADDVIFTYEYASNPDVGAGSRGLYSGIESIEALDPYTIQINFSDVTPNWAGPFVGKWGMILPKHIFSGFNGSNARSAAANQLPIGTGPYYGLENEEQEVVSLGDGLVQRRRIVFARNPYFREGAPYFDKVILEQPSSNSLTLAESVIESDANADYAWNLALTGDELVGLEESPNGGIIITFGSRVERIVINHSDPNTQTAVGERSNKDNPHPFLSDIQVRQAFNLAIDRDRIAALYGESGNPTNNNLMFDPFFMLDNSYIYDARTAQGLLTAAGWVDTDGDGIRDKDGVPMKVTYLAYFATLIQETQAIVKENLEEIGVDVELSLVSSRNFFARPSTPNSSNGVTFIADIQEYDVRSVSPDPDSYMGFWTCSAIPQLANGWSGLNLERWCHQPAEGEVSYDDLYAQSKIELDPDRRRDLFIQMNQILVDEVVMIPLVHWGEVSAVNNTIEGVDPTPWDSSMWNIKDWRRNTP
jgi:peptide/nickel transport system substrate-binding protein